MALNPNDTTYNDATLDDLINDAIERGDIEALNWLDTESGTFVERKRNNKVIKVRKSISKIRAEYRTTFLDYKADNKKSAEIARQRKAKEEEAKRKAKFEEARKRLAENKKKSK